MMTVSEALIRAKARIEHYKTMQQCFSDMPGEAAYYKANAEVLETLCEAVEQAQQEKEAKGDA